MSIEGKKPNNTFFFIVGRGRSGTDLLQSLLNTHVDICIPPEASTVPLLYHKYHSQTKWNEKKKIQFIHDVFLDNKINAWWGLTKQFVNDSFKSVEIMSFGEGVKFLYRLFATKSGANSKVLGDKNPANTLYMDKIEKVFPNSKFIALVRNPIDNVNSFMNVSFDSNNPKILAHRWDFYNKHILEFKKRKPEKLLIVNYENLVNDTENSLSIIADFLSIENDFYVEKKRQKKHKWQNNLEDDISQIHIGKGEENLSSTEIKYINSICAHTASKLNYTIKPGKKSYNPIAFVFNQIEKWYIILPLFLSTTLLNYYRGKKKIVVKN